MGVSHGTPPATTGGVFCSGVIQEHDDWLHGHFKKNPENYFQIHNFKHLKIL
jgi:hypothetical protein